MAPIVKAHAKDESPWYLAHYLAEERQQQIIARCCKAKRCSRAEREKITNTVALGWSPTGSKSAWRKATAKKKRKRAPAKKGAKN